MGKIHIDGAVYVAEEKVCEYVEKLQTENIELRKLLKEAFPLLHSRADSESLGPKSLVTRIFDIALKEK